MVVWSRVRKDFPALDTLYNGKRLIYFDSACMSLKPIQVWEAMEYYYKYLGSCGGAGRSTHYLGDETTALVEEARKKIADFINAKTSEEVIWTRNATEALNLVASTISINKDSNFVTTTLEHHSGMLPFYKRAKQAGIEFRLVEADREGRLDPAEFEKKIDDNTRIVSLVHASNVTGTIAPLKEIIDIAHEHGALVVSDEAQYFPHHKLDVKSLDIDFCVISLHKALGPTGMGILYGKYELLEELDMFLVGGDVIEDVIYKDGEIIPKYLPPPHKFEAGLQDYAGMIGAGAAIDYLEKIGMNEIEKREKILGRKLLEGILELEKFEILGPKEPKERSALVSFYAKSPEITHNDISMYMNDMLPHYRILLRAGGHCVHPFQYQIGLDIGKGRGTVRASLYFYNTQHEIEVFLNALEDLAKTIE